MGGAIFIRTGTLSLSNTSFSSNIAVGGTGGSGLGGAIFAMKSTTNSNGNNQGMPSTLPTVNLDNVSFSGNSASSQTGAVNNNNDFFGAIDPYTVINTSDSGTGSLRWAVSNANAAGSRQTVTFSPGLSGQTITLNSTIDITSSVTIQGGQTITVAASSSSPLFNINSGGSSRSAVALNGLTLSGSVTNAETLTLPISSTVSGGITNTGEVIFTGSQSNDTLTGTSGIDQLRGFSGNDTLSGLAGNDQVLGAAGNDVLNGGSGNDRLRGGLGNDQFVFASGAAFAQADFGLDVVTDFTPGRDKLALSATSFASLSSAVGSSLSSSEFATVASGNGARLAAKIIYNSSNGQVTYNENGAAAGLGSGANFAYLTTLPNLSASDFVVRS